MPKAVAISRRSRVTAATDFEPAGMHVAVRARVGLEYRDRMTVSTRTLGRSGLVVSALGLGCMGMSEFYGQADETTSIDTLHKAIDLGVTFLDTSDVYGPFTNERLVGRAISDSRNR